MYEWDEAKRLINLENHKLDFLDVPQLFDGRAVFTSASKYAFELRMVTTVMHEGKSCTVIWTQRGGARRIISFRRARREEEREYRQFLS